MPNSISLENNFTQGLKTEFTGLNFPENAATDTDNCIYTLLGDVVRRGGFDYEANYLLTSYGAMNGKAINTHRWLNVGEDSSTQILVVQIGSSLHFYRTTDATIASPISHTLVFSPLDLTTFSVSGAPSPVTTECQFIDGNGYLFVLHPNLEPFYCTYGTGGITSTKIDIQIRDFMGVSQTGIPIDYRPPTMTNPHLYNLLNQGWTDTAAIPWQANSTTSVTVGTGSKTFTVQSGLTVTLGTSVNIIHPVYGYGVLMRGTVTSYSSTTMVISVTNYATPDAGNSHSLWQIFPLDIATGHLSTWLGVVGLYPSDADVWWRFKNSTGVFSPSTTLTNVSVSSTPAPKGHYILSAFNQQRTLVSAVGGITDVVTRFRPKTGCWFQGRMWYTGVDAVQAATGNMPQYAWTENIYFSQIVTDPTKFGLCYQTNDPTTDGLFDLLPTDGGVITIQGCGSIYKLFPMQNSLLVFAANGVWFVTGSSGIGFSANDYTIVKVSSVQSISSTSFVDVQGMPIFWNEEGIYNVDRAEQGKGLLSNPLFVSPVTVNPITVGTILSFYESIPLRSKKYARGAYNPIDYMVQWIYRGTEETNITDRYNFDKVLNFNTVNKAFFPYSLNISEGLPHIKSIDYIAGPGGSTSPAPRFKYLTAVGVANCNSYSITFSEEIEDQYYDWMAPGYDVNYVSYFVTGYKLHSKAIASWQPEYVYMFSRNDVDTAYKIQGIWNYASDRSSGKYSSIQLINNVKQYFNKLYRRHRIRGQGLVLQLKVISVDGMPFDIMGWSVFETSNASP